MVEVQIRIFLMDKVEVQFRILLRDKYLAKIVSKYKHLFLQKQLANQGIFLIGSELSITE